MNSDQEWNPPHAHDPNPSPPTDDPTVTLARGESKIALGPTTLRDFPQRTVANCYIVSTGHGTSGPFSFSGVPLAALIARYHPEPWRLVDVISADGFRTRLPAEEVIQADDLPIILALSVDGRPLTRQEGLVRLIVPQELDDALRQVKWVKELRVVTR